MHEQLTTYLAGLPGWQSIPEVSFSFYGERGVVDILGWHAQWRAVLVVEIKTEISDVNELMGTLVRKRRLAPRIATERGWDSLTVGVWLVVAESSTNRRRVEAHRMVLRSALPMNGRAIPGWLREPSSGMAGLSFWSDARGAHVGRPIASAVSEGPSRRLVSVADSGARAAEVLETAARPAYVRTMRT